jgi:hypothetical protein
MNKSLLLKDDLLFGALSFDPLRILTVAVALLLPYVFIEPAPVDIFLLLMTIYILLNMKLSAFPFIVYLSYLSFTLISTLLGLILGTGNNEIIFQYFFIEFYLATSLLSISAICYQRDYFITLFLRWYVIGAAISSILVLSIKFGPDNVSLIYRDEWEIRIKGFFKDPNVLAPYLVFPIVAMYFSSVALNLKRWKYIILFSCLSLMILTFSRGGYVALFSSILFGVMLKILIELSLRTVITTITFFLIISFGLLWLIDNGYIDNTAYFFNRFELKDYDEGRFYHLANALEIGFLNPFGLGPGSYGNVYNLNPHNLFVGKLADSGLIPAIIITCIPIGGWFLSTLSFLKYRDDLSLILAATMVGQVAAASVVYAHHWRHLLILGVISSAYAINNSYKNSRKGYLATN